MAKKLQLNCRITGGRDDVCIHHLLELELEGSLLSFLSEKLAVLRDCVNESLSELVDKEKAMVANGPRQVHEEARDSGSLFSMLGAKFTRTLAKPS